MFQSARWLSGCLFALLFVLVPQTCTAGDWPAFRGPAGDGKSSDTGFPIEWSSMKNVKWRVALTSPGNSSPIVVGERVLFTSANSDGHERSVICFHREDGKELWRQSIAFGQTELTHKTNPYCPSTPVSDGDSVFVWHGSAGMHAYSLDGKSRWSRDLGSFSHVWGLGASPILFGDWVIQLCGPGERTFVVALHRQTGEIGWQTPNEVGGSESRQGRYVGTWATPYLARIDGMDQLICCFHSRVVGLEPKTGKERWSIGGLSNDRSDLSYAMPMVAEKNVVVMGGFGGPEFGFRLEGPSLNAGKDWLWRNEKFEGRKFHPQRIGSGVTLGLQLFMANADEAGSVECIDTDSGHRRWVHPRTTDGPHWGSIILAEGRLYLPGQKGITRVLKADTEKYEVIAENDLGEHCNATPAFSNGEIFIRTFDALYAIQSKQ